MEIRKVGAAVAAAAGTPVANVVVGTPVANAAAGKKEELVGAVLAAVAGLVLGGRKQRKRVLVGQVKI